MCQEGTGKKGFSPLLLYCSALHVHFYCYHVPPSIVIGVCFMAARMEKSRKAPLKKGLREFTPSLLLSTIPLFFQCALTSLQNFVFCNIILWPISPVKHFFFFSETHSLYWTNSHKTDKERESFFGLHCSNKQQKRITRGRSRDGSHHKFTCFLSVCVSLLRKFFDQLYVE